MLASKQKNLVLLYVLCEEGSAELWKCQEFGRLHCWARMAALVWLLNRVKQVGSKTSRSLPSLLLQTVHGLLSELPEKGLCDTFLN